MSRILKGVPFIAGTVAGALFTIWFMTPAPLPTRDLQLEKLRSAELQTKIDLATLLEWPCIEGAITATPDGVIGQCKDGRWTVSNPELNRHLVELQVGAPCPDHPNLRCQFGEWRHQ